MAGDIDDFIARHGMVQMVVDEKGLKASCATNAEILERVGISETELGSHIKLFEIDGYTAAPIKNTFCTRDAIRLIGEKLETVLK